MNLFELLAGSDNHPALVSPEGSVLTYKQLRENVVELVSQLNSFGLKRGDRIAIAMTNGIPVVITFLAASLCATAAPLNPKYKPEEFAFYYQDTQAKALITLPDVPETAIAAAIPDMMRIHASINALGISFELVKSPVGVKTSGNQNPDSDDVAMILHTSGTTSRPKRVPIRHRHLIATAHHMIGAYSLSAVDTTLCLMPLFHIHGLVCMLTTLASGGTLVIPNGFNALNFWRLVETFKPTWYSAAPTIHQTILSRVSHNLPIVKANPFRFIRSSSAPLPPVILEQMEAKLNAPVLEAYSMTEAAHLMTTNPLPPKVRKPGTVGYGFGVEVSIMDEDGNFLPQGSLGEVVVKGPNVIDGYENNPQANATAFVNGWFRTGDQGKLDADGYLRITGRIKELINRGGEKISPLEVDDVLLRHPAVAEALAFAVPHKSLGEDIHAAVVLNGETSVKELLAHCSTMLADFKVPHQIHILDELPRGATGKLQRLSMAKLLKIEQ
ncbi:MAG: AMP-binding protein [Stigonema ocellatum SAG 48.90 = DSM 106950]|nr:AMP-binding protein [Stigonema ocellatum SAG 48.90 = DSM 106950]